MTTLPIGIFLLLSIPGLSAQADNTRKNKQDPAHPEMTADKQGQGKADLELSRKIRQAVMADKNLSTNARNVKIITNDGKVVLRGPVANEKEKSAIQRFADDAAGASNVTNRIEIAASPAKEN